MKTLYTVLFVLGAVTTASARDSVSKNDSVLIRKVERLEQRVDAQERQITELKTHNGKMNKKMSGTTEIKRTGKAVVNRRGSKQVTFE
ncbi:MAG: hypothetical protein INR69_01690 [Mucilaginibacter polytrichastri]|nr:hypothetical protein [Mucilaginibacter polytrichastri]